MLRETYLVEDFQNGRMDRVAATRLLVMPRRTRTITLAAMTTHDGPFLFVELGLAVVGLAVLARLAQRWGLSAIPLYLLAGLAFGKGGLAPLKLSENFVRTGQRSAFSCFCSRWGWSTPETS